LSLVCLSPQDRRVAGLKQVLRYLKQGFLEKVFIAKDADEEIACKLVHACERYSVPYDMTHTMHQIGSACQIEVGSACAGVVKSNI
jgi:large subunit ribosomal protein L7A